MTRSSPLSPDSYAQAYAEEYGFEEKMVRGRQKLLSELIDRLKPARVVEVGCGMDLLCECLSPDSPDLAWVIVEPSERFAKRARQAAPDTAHVTVIQQPLEGAVAQLASALDGAPELVICSSLLHEVADVGRFLRAAKEALRDGPGLLHINVPNAGSLHRRLARRMGLIRDETELTARNQRLGQPRVFDAETLERAVTAAGLNIVDRGGYMLKPFTHEQMEGLAFLDAPMLAGLWELGRDLPELASEIFVNARLP